MKHEDALVQIRNEYNWNEDQFNRFENVVANVMMARREFIKQLTDPRRSIEDECGYPKGVITAQMYQDLFDKEPIASKVVNVYPKECWRVQPTVYEDQDPNTQTPFEEAWDQLGKNLLGESSWYKDEQGSKIWTYFKRADVLCGVGQYAVILLGIDDNKPLSEPAEFVTGDVPSYSDDQVYTPLAGTDEQYFDLYQSQQAIVELTPAKPTRMKLPKGAKRRLMYMRVFPESEAQIVAFDNNRQSPRYGRPTKYQITFNSPNANQQGGIGLTQASQIVHWTRCVHIVDTLNSSEVFGVPRMQKVYNRLLDLNKLYGGCAEMYWRGAFPGFALSTHPQLGGDVKIDRAAIKDGMEQYMNGLQRYMLLMGMSAQSLAPQVVDPSPQIDKEIEAICIEKDCPKRIFMGAERGELASTQDDDNWNDRVKERQNNVVTPQIIAPTVDRLIALGCLPEPESWYTEWPDITSRSAQEKATTALTRTQALAAYAGGDPSSVMAPLDYLTKELGYDEEDAQNILDNAEEHVQEQHEKDMQMQQDQIDAGLAANPADMTAGLEGGDTGGLDQGAGSEEPAPQEGPQALTENTDWSLDYTINPFVSEAQRRACYAQDDSDWDCEEWNKETKGKLPKRKKTHNEELEVNNESLYDDWVVELPLDEYMAFDEFEERLIYQNREYKRASDGRFGTVAGQHQGKKIPMPKQKALMEMQKKHLQLSTAAAKMGDLDTKKKHLHVAYGYGLAAKHQDDGNHAEARRVFDKATQIDQQGLELPKKAAADTKKPDPKTTGQYGQWGKAVQAATQPTPAATTTKPATTSPQGTSKPQQSEAEAKKAAKLKYDSHHEAVKTILGKNHGSLTDSDVASLTESLSHLKSADLTAVRKQFLGKGAKVKKQIMAESLLELAKSKQVKPTPQGDDAAKSMLSAKMDAAGMDPTKPYHPSDLNGVIDHKAAVQQGHAEHVSTKEGPKAVKVLPVAKRLPPKAAFDHGPKFEDTEAGKKAIADLMKPKGMKALPHAPAEQPTHDAVPSKTLGQKLKGWGQKLQEWVAKKVGDEGWLKQYVKNELSSIIDVENSGGELVESFLLALTQAVEDGDPEAVSKLVSMLHQPEEADNADGSQQAA